MRTKKVYHDQVINGIKVNFTGLNDEDRLGLQKPYSYIYELQHFGTANFQPEDNRIYDIEVFKLNMMLYAYILKSPYKNEVSGFLHQLLQRLYDVVIENQDLHKLVYDLGQCKKIIVPEHLKVDYIPKQKIKIREYSHENLNPAIQKQFVEIEHKETQLKKDGPRKILTEYENSRKAEDFPILDPELFVIYKVVMLFNEKYHDKDLFSVMASILDKINKTSKDNFALQIKLERMGV